MPIPTAGPLSTDIIADEVGYTTSYLHNLAGPLKSDNTPGTYSLTYFFRNGNVSTSGVTQSAPFGMSAFYGQEAIYRCVTFTASGAVVGTATVVSYYKTLQTITFSSARKSFCVRQNWDGQMAISNVLGGTYSIGLTCSAMPGQSIVSNNTVYTTYGVRVYNMGGYNIDGNTGSGGSLAFSASTVNFGGTFSNLWWANPTSVSSNGRLNRTGLWNDTNVPTTPTTANFYVGQGFISFSVLADTTRQYYVGVGGDNYITIKLDGATCVSLTGSNPGVSFGQNDQNFKFWHIYPITFSAGLRRLDIIGNNEDGQGSMGAEVYGNTLSSLKDIFDNAIPNSSATPSGLNLLYTSADFRSSGTFFQNLAFTCPTIPTTTTTTTTTTTSTTTTTTTLGLFTITWSVNVGAPNQTLIISTNLQGTVVNSTPTNTNDSGSFTVATTGEQIFVSLVDASSPNPALFAQIDWTITDNGSTLYTNSINHLSYVSDSYGPYTPTGNGDITLITNYF